MKLQKTITTIFMVPTLSISRDKLTTNNFINGYVKDGRREVQYENCIYLLFKPENLDRFRDFLDEEYERTKSIIDDYDYEDGYVVVVYTLNSRLAEDFELVKQSKYSKTSPKFQEIFPKIVKDGPQKGNIGLQYRIFNKTEDLKKYWEDMLDMSLDENSDIEYWQGFFEENETLNLDKIKSNV
jgi:hypothetical protein